MSFIHTPKSAGNEIERLAKRAAGLHWGQLYELPRWERAKTAGAAVPAVSTTLNVTTPRAPRKAGRRKAQQPGGGRAPRGVCLRGNTDQCCSWWHIPPKLLNDSRPYFAAPIRFCVVRNPYSRVLSEYGYQTGANKPRKSSCPDGPEGRATRDSWILRSLAQYARGEYAKGRADCHMLPQSLFVAPHVDAAWLNEFWGGRGGGGQARHGAGRAAAGGTARRAGSAVPGWGPQRRRAAELQRGAPVRGTGIRLCGVQGLGRAPC